MKDYSIGSFLTASQLAQLRTFVPKTREEYLCHMQIIYNLKLATSFPLIVHIEPTNHCNLKCRMCQHPSMTRPKMHIDPELVHKAIDECALNGGAWFLHFFFFGEPFLNNETINYIRYAREKGLQRLSVTTNFSTITHKQIRELVDLPLTSIVVSFEGLNRQRYRIVRGHDCFEQVYKNIKYLLKYREEKKQTNPWVTLTYVRTDETDDEIAEFEDMWRDKVDAIHISPQFDYLSRAVLSSGRLNDGGILERDQNMRQPCRQLWLRLVVLSNGEIVPCSQNMDGELSLGNIRDTSLAQAWCGDLLADLRCQHLHGSFASQCVCRKCIDWDWSGKIDNRPKFSVEC